MARIEKSIEIKAPAEEVWKMLLPDRIPEWLKGIEVEYTSEEKEVIGATAHVVGEAPGIKVEWDIEITEYKKNKEARWRSTRGDVTALGFTTLQSTERGTIGNFVLDYELPYSILGKIVDKIFVGRELDQSIENGLGKLKNMLEN